MTQQRALDVAIPDGWTVRETVREDIGDRVVAKSADDREQATISTMVLNPTFDIFEKACRLRLQIEQRRPDVRLRIGLGPSDEGGQFLMSYTGYEPAVARLFSAFLFLKPSEAKLLTVYVEGVAVENDRHVNSFMTYVNAARGWYEGWT